MRSTTPKVLHRIAGRPLIEHVLTAVGGSTEFAVVVGPDHDAVAAAVRALRPEATIVVQSERRGTAHAVLAARIGPYDAQANAAISGLTRALADAGSPAASAGREALVIISGLVNRQALAMSYLDGFRLVSILLFATAPLVWLMHRRERRN